jgi:Raf kinase inhibitor-like YbhB/YbcL family protein
MEAFMKSWIPVLGLLSWCSAHALELRSDDVREGVTLNVAQVFNGFGCEGLNVSPQLSWRSAPQGTKSFAVTLYDPDAPTGSGWWHWTVFNIPASAGALMRGAGSGQADLPTGAVQGRTDFGRPGFGGACPPAGAKPHRYQLTVWALNTERLDLDEQASGALVGFMLNAHVLDKATITGRYGR